MGSHPLGKERDNTQTVGSWGVLWEEVRGKVPGQEAVLPGGEQPRGEQGLAFAGERAE